MKVLKVRSSHKNSNSKKKQSQFSIIFILASQYRSHTVLLSSAVHCPRWFLSMGSRRLHSMQQGSGRIPMRWKMCTQAIMPNAQSKFCNCLSSRPVWYFGLFLASTFVIYLTSYSAQVKNDWRYTSTPLITFLAWKRTTLTFTCSLPQTQAI